MAHGRSSGVASRPAWAARAAIPVHRWSLGAPDRLFVRRRRAIASLPTATFSIDTRRPVAFRSPAYASRPR
jgi:hypothetical protein